MNTLNYESKKSKRISVLACVITAVISVILTLVICALIVFSVPGFANLLCLNSLINLYHLNDTDNASIESGILNGYLSGLDDKYAFYYNDKGTEERTDYLMGVGNGIGVTVIAHPDMNAMYVLRVYDDSPAEKAGISVGDIITAVDGVSVSSVGFNEAVNMIAREVGESVSISVLRGETELVVNLVVANLTVQTVFYSQISDYGYIEITSFNSETVPQFEKAVSALTEAGVRGLIFDLRGNGGGTVDSVGNILDILVPEGDVMTVRYRGGAERVMLSSDSSHIDLPMVVLTDDYTASASELFAATIRDFNKGVLVGTTTYGKGVMQNTYSLLNGSSAVFTVAEFLPHSKKSFNLVGLVPDIEIELTDAESKYRYLNPIASDRVVIGAIEWLDGELE